MPPRIPRPRTPAQLARIQRHRKQRKAVNRLFDEALYTGAFSIPVLREINLEEHRKQKRQKNFRPLKFQPPSSVKRQVVTAWLAKGARRGVKVTPSDVISAGEFVSSKGPRITLKSFKARDFRDFKRRLKQNKGSKIPKKWGKTPAGKFDRILNIQGIGTVWAEFSLDERFQITALEFGLVEKGKKTDLFFPDKEESVRELLFEALAEELAQEQEKRGEFSD